jgi:hypothetical protein
MSRIKKRMMQRITKETELSWTMDLLIAAPIVDT